MIAPPRPIAVALAGLVPALLSPAFLIVDQGRLAAGLAAAAFTLVSGGLLAFYAPTFLKRRPRLALTPFAIPAAAGGVIVGIPPWHAIGAAVLAVALVGFFAVLLVSPRRESLPLHRAPTAHASTDRVVVALVLVGLLLVAAAPVLFLVAPGPAGWGALVGWAAAWTHAGVVHMMPRALKAPRPALPFLLAAVVLLLAPLTVAVAVAAAAALVLLGLGAPAFTGDPGGGLLRHGRPLVMTGIALEVLALATDASSLATWLLLAMGSGTVAGGLLAQLGPVAANQVPRHHRWARLAAGLAATSGIAAVALDVSGGPAALAGALPVVAVIALAWDVLPLGTPRRPCPPPTPGDGS